MNKNIFFRLDWLSIILYLLLVSFGLVNIYSSDFSNKIILFWDPDYLVGKQFWIFIACLIILPLILAVKSNFFEHLTYIFYGISIFSLLGLFIFGETISGATSWYSLGSFSLQPSEFAKITTAMVVALNLGSFQNDLKKNTHLLKIILLVSLPMLLIILQPDAGSALVFMGIFFVLIREGLNLKFLFLAMGLLLIFILTLLFSPLNLSLVMGFIFFIIYNMIKRRYPKTKKSPFISTLIFGIVFSYSVSLIFNTVFEQRHRDRFNIILGLETDSRGIGYNINQSKIAIGSGGFSGKGFRNGSQTKGNFVPEQETDYIFSIVGEEWGFLGSVTLILLFVILIFRIIYKAERHSSAYARVFSYTFASMLFVHFFVNIGMTLGLVPTVGIPLPFISYGGSNLLAFSLMFFIYLNFDANRLDY